MFFSVLDESKEKFASPITDANVGNEADWLGINPGREGKLGKDNISGLGMLTD